MSDQPPAAIIHGLPAYKYQSTFALSNTGLSALARCPEIFYGRYLDPARPQQVQTASQRDGTLAHCAVLEPEEFERRYRIGPAGTRAAKAWKEAEAQASADGVELIKADEYDTAHRQAESVRRLPEVAELLSAGAAEVSAFWRDPITGILCKCRPDWVHPAGSASILVDLKTYGNARPAEFSRQIGRMGYHRQDAHYSAGYSIASSSPVLAFVFCAVETDHPYSSCAVMLDEPSRDQGRREVRRLTDIYAHCLATNTWAGYVAQIEEISLPRYLLED